MWKMAPQKWKSTFAEPFPHSGRMWPKRHFRKSGAMATLGPLAQKPFPLLWSHGHILQKWPKWPFGPLWQSHVEILLRGQKRKWHFCGAIWQNVEDGSARVEIHFCGAISTFWQNVAQMAFPLLRSHFHSLPEGPMAISTFAEPSGRMWKMAPQKWKSTFAPSWPECGRWLRKSGNPLLRSHLAECGRWLRKSGNPLLRSHLAECGRWLRKSGNPLLRPHGQNVSDGSAKVEIHFCGAIWQNVSDGSAKVEIHFCGAIWQNVEDGSAKVEMAFAEPSGRMWK